MSGAYSPALSIQYRSVRSPNNSKTINVKRSPVGIDKPAVHVPMATPAGNTVPKTATTTQNRGANFPVTISLTEVLPVAP